MRKRDNKLCCTDSTSLEIGGKEIKHRRALQKTVDLMLATT